MNSQIKLFNYLYGASSYVSTRSSGYYSIKKKPKIFERKLLKLDVPVEKDASKLHSEVCGTNFLEEGGENIKIKPDSEYPDWLWKIHIGPPLPLEKLDPNTKHYWNRVNKWGRLEDRYLLNYKKYKTLQK